ncbi:MAG TPA: glycoside hydrolase family 2 TIM barrel-domain containing protein [Longimicrobiaceae bacterium]|nr:glycoside hydrolase family 2 TIM barrel-domain containing protein [Longimicrobiaceae bacterium]
MQISDFGFTRDREMSGYVEEYLNPLPRAVIRPTDYELLDGEWRFDLDLEDRGLSERWYLGHEYRHTATWPGSVEAHMIEAKQAQQHTPAWQGSVVVWYEREFTVPEQWCIYPDCLLQVTFGACGYETRVWLNGRLLRTVEGEDVHLGEYTSFSYELPPEWLQPVNRLTVRIADSMDAEIPRGKQESHVYKRGGIWYQTYTGAVRSVWLEPVQRNRLRSRVNVLSNYRDRFVSFDLTTRVHDPGIYSLRLVVAPRGSEEPAAVAQVELPLEPGEKRQRVTVELPDAALWSPATPNLYHLVAQLTGPNGTVSQIETRFGLRTIEARGRSVYLNNRPLYLDGILYQPATASFEEMERHMRAMKRLGCNLVRVHIAGIDPRIYALADEIGVLLWVEVPSPHSSSPLSRENHWAEMMRMLVHIGSHPSVVIWSLYNEDWGAQDIATNEETRRYVARAYDYLRLNHPQLLVVDNDGWNHVSVEGRLKSDLLTAHMYTPKLERWRELLDRLAEGHNEGVAVEPLVVGDPYFYCGQVPLVVSEWGGFGFVEYGGPEDPEARVGRIREFKRELRLRPIAGDVYTQAVSIEEEDNGLIDPQTGELLVPPGLLDSSGMT